MNNQYRSQMSNDKCQRINNQFQIKIIYQDSYIINQINHQSKILLNNIVNTMLRYGGNRQKRVDADTGGDEGAVGDI